MHNFSDQINANGFRSVCNLIKKLKVKNFDESKKKHPLFFFKKIAQKVLTYFSMTVQCTRNMDFRKTENVFSNYLYVPPTVW